MNVVYRFRIYPNKIQQELFAKTFGCVRFVYNRMLAEKKECYEKTGKNLKVTPAKYKAEFPWLKEVDSLALCNAQLPSCICRLLIKTFSGIHRLDFQDSSQKRILLKAIPQTV